MVQAQGLVPGSVEFQENRQYSQWLGIRLENASGCNAVSFEVDLPSGISTGTVETPIDPLHQWDMSDRKFMCYSTDNAPLEDESSFIGFSLTDLAGLYSGTVNGYLRNVEISTKECTLLRLPDIPFSITFPEAIPGDTNLDGRVNDTDKIKIVDYLLGKDPLYFNDANADLNADGEVTVSDLVIIISLLNS